MIGRYILNLLIGVDELFNAVLLGDPEETISSRAGKAMQKGKRWGCLLCSFLDLLQKDHCLKSLEPDEGSRAILPD